VAGSERLVDGDVIADGLELADGVVRAAMSISPAAPSRYCSRRCRNAAWQTRHRRARDSAATNVVATIHDVAGGLSQESFALVLGVHRTYVGGLERGERNLTLNADCSER
jgi:Helix-turn-helix